MKHTLMIKRMLTICLTMVLLAAAAGAVALSPATYPAYNQELKSGNRGEDVLALQQRLSELGYYHGPQDGMFNAQTLQALILFQQQNNLLATGTLDAATHAVLYSAAALPYAAPKLDAMVESYSRIPPAGAVADTAFFMPAAPFNTNEYKAFQDNRFLSVITSPLSTFAADVDTASYAQLRRMILAGTPVPADSVRIEEMLNYFQYSYKQPDGNEPLGVTMELGVTPWNPDTWLLLIGLQAKEIPQQERPRQNLVFLIDVSGSMNVPDKLPLVKRSFQMLLEELAPEDTISIVTYASRDEIVLDGMRAGDKTTIMDKVDSLSAGGMTAGAAGISTAYALAAKHFIEGGNNRILLATDGDLNLGISDEGSLARLVEEKKKGGIFLSVLGFGDGNYKDNKLEALADRGDGNYSYIDTIYEARKALVTEIGATFFAVAKNVKLQMDFNPTVIKGYRLIGYENRLLDAEDFADDTVDGGELGSGHRLTALYELVPVGSAYNFGETGSKYQPAAPKDGDADEALTLSIRAMAPDGDKSHLYTYPLKASNPAPLTDNLKFAAAVAQMGMLLRDSKLKGTATYASTLALLRDCQSITGNPYKEEFLYLVTLLDRQEEVKP
jgi:Ca-activated chloride channel family protein